MAKFTFGVDVDIHWNGYEIQGPALTEFTIPDQLYEEFESDFRPVEPSLTWIDTNEFATLTAAVSVTTLSATAPIELTATSTGKIISFSSGTASNGYLLTANGSGGTVWSPAATSGLTSVVGISPISASIAGGIASVSLDASYASSTHDHSGTYQPAGTYVTSVVGTSPVSASGTTAITVTIDQTLLTAGAATTAEGLRTPVKNSTGSTIDKGSVVYVTGADGTNALIGLATASTEIGSSKVLGIVSSTLTNNAFGYVTQAGQLSGIDTSAATAGSSVWLGNAPGSFVFNSPPAEPSNSVYLGVVTKANPSTGEILVKVQNGYELDELHDVYVGGVSTALPLVYSSTSSGWVAQALDSVGIANDAIVSAKILDGAVTSAKIADNAVVSAKINAGAVGTAKISSGSAASSTVLTADGAGNASFSSLVAPSWSSATPSYTVSSASSVMISGNTATGNGQGQSRLVLAHPTSALIWTVYKSAAGTTEWLRKIDSSAMTTVANYAITMLDSAEYVESGAVSPDGKVMVVTLSSLYHRWIIIDGNNGSSLASGNVINVGTIESGIPPTVRHDDNAGQFVISTRCTTATNSRTVYRFVDSSTYTTKVHTWNTSTMNQAVTTATTSNMNFWEHSLPVWIPDASRWVINFKIDGGNDGGSFFVFLSASTATADFLTVTGKQCSSNTTNGDSGGNQGSNSHQTVLATTTTLGKGLMHAKSYGTTTGTRIRYLFIPLSGLSAAYNAVVSTAPSGALSLLDSFSSTASASPGSPGNFASAIGVDGSMYVGFGYNTIYQYNDAYAGLNKVGTYPHQVTSYTSLTDNSPYEQVLAIHTVGGTSYAYYYYAVTGSQEIRKTKLRDSYRPVTVVTSTSQYEMMYVGTVSATNATFDGWDSNSLTVSNSSLTQRLVLPNKTVSIYISGSTASVDGSVSFTYYKSK